MAQQQIIPGVDAPQPQQYDELHLEEKRLFEEMLGDLPWADVYLALLEEGWAWRKAAYIAWASLPAEGRHPRFLKEFASIVGLNSTRAIRNWRMQNKAIDLAVQKLSMSMLLEHAPEVVDALIESASDPGYKHAPDRRVALEMMGMYTPRQRLGLFEDEPAEADMENLSNEELARLAGVEAEEVPTKAEAEEAVPAQDKDDAGS